MPTPARAAALRVLRESAQGGNTLAEALAQPAVDALDERERGLVHELVLGTLRRRGWLDHVLAGLAERPLGRLTPGVRDALRLGAYQLLFTRVAPHAAVSESVDLARLCEPRAAGFANAVLRRLQREGAPAAPDEVRDPLGFLTTWGSLPGWLAARWLERLGAERSVARARALLEPPPVHFRSNPRRSDAATRLADAGVCAVPLAVPSALEALEGRLQELAAEGTVYVQDEGSQLVAHLAAVEGLVLDACAAPGGKSLLLADLGAGRTRVVAAEVSRRRARTLAALGSRWGASEVRVVVADARRPPFLGAFDGVLLDAPCSGLGTLARHPDIRWRLRPADIAHHARRQTEMLASLAGLVRPGGRLVYATCSVEPEENEGVLVPFLAGHCDFSPAPLPAWAESFAEGSFVRMEPAKRRGDAFFAAVLRRAPLC